MAPVSVRVLGRQREVTPDNLSEPTFMTGLLTAVWAGRDVRASKRGEAPGPTTVGRDKERKQSFWSSKRARNVRSGHLAAPGWSWREAATARELELKEGESREEISHISLLVCALFLVAWPNLKRN